VSPLCSPAHRAHRPCEPKISVRSSGAQVTEITRDTGSGRARCSCVHFSAWSPGVRRSGEVGDKPWASFALRRRRNHPGELRLRTFPGNIDFCGYSTLLPSFGPIRTVPTCWSIGHRLAQPSGLNQLLVGSSPVAIRYICHGPCVCTMWEVAAQRRCFLLGSSAKGRQDLWSRSGLFVTQRNHARLRNPRLGSAGLTRMSQ